MLFFRLETVRKKCPQSGGRGLFIADNEGGGSVEEDIRTFCCKKLKVSKIVVCPHRQGELGSIFGDFVQTYRSWTAPW